MSKRPQPRKAFPDREPPADHPLNPAREPEPSRLAEAPRVPFGTRIPADLAKQVRVAAAQRETSVQEIVEQALRGWLERSGPAD